MFRSNRLTSLLVRCNNLNKSHNLNNINIKNASTQKLIDFLKSDYTANDSSTQLKYYDPPYLNKKPPFPNYDLLNINLKGYDATSLDTYFKYVDKLCKSFKLDVVEAYCMPARSQKVKTYQPFSSNLDKEYKLQVYHRVVRIQHLKSTLAPFLFEAIQLNLPEGVQMNVSVPNKEEDEFRYVPDIELNQLKEKLEEMTKKPKDEATVSTSATSSTPQIKK